MLTILAFLKHQHFSDFANFGAQLLHSCTNARVWKATIYCGLEPARDQESSGTCSTAVNIVNRALAPLRIINT